MAVGVVHADAVVIQYRDLLVLQENHVARVAQQRRDVRRDKALAVLCTNHQRAVVARAKQLARLPVAYHAQRVAALQHPHQADERGLHIALVQVVQQVRHDLGIGLADKHRALALQEFAQGGVVFDDAVMHHRNAVFEVGMRVRVQVAGLAVGRPAGVPDADAAVHGLGLQQTFQVFQASLGFFDVDLVIAVDDRYPGGIIPTIG